jgi:two-component system nitrate/nitrite response regulator NarL
MRSIRVYGQPELRKQSGDAVAAGTALTNREREIVRLVSEGLSNKEIGRRLKITDGTIKQHVHHIFQKLQISNRTELAAVYFSLPEPQKKVLLPMPSKD